MNVKESVRDSLILSRTEQILNYREWMTKLPAFHFDKEWDVRIIPPFGGAIIRFTIEYKGKHISVYFDAYSNLGFVYEDNNGEKPIPYFEYYDGDNIHRYYLNEADQMMEDIREFLNGENKDEEI